MRLLFTLLILGMTSMTLADEQANGASKLVKNHTLGTLSTLMNGQPFMSAAPYAYDDQGRVIIMISDLAQHTANVKANTKASVFVMKPDPKDDFNGSRVTLIGDMKLVPKDEIEKVAEIFVKRHPKGKLYQNFHDFNFYRLDIEKIYYIGGFGDIGWVSKENYAKTFGK